MSSTAAPLRRKITFVGENNSGKTSLIFALSRGIFPEIIPAIFDTFSAQVTVDGVPLDIELWDVCDNEDYECLRVLVYPGSNVVFICFAINSPYALEMVEKKWFREVQRHSPDTPILVIGCKKDLRCDTELNSDNMLPTFRQGEAMAKRLDATYFECSAKTMDGIDDLLNLSAVISLTLPKKETRKQQCLII